MADISYSVARDILRFEGLDRAAYWRRFAMLLTLSVVMATIGLYRSSAAVVIAAMLIAPLMAPILGIASAMMLGRLSRTLKLAAVVLLASLCTMGLAYLMMFVANAPRGMLISSEVLARTDPGIEELGVALAAGLAGAYVQIQRTELSLLPGAAIGVSLVPPLAAAGILVYFREYANAFEAYLLFLTNLGAIVISACAVYLRAGISPGFVRGNRRLRGFSTGLIVTLGCLALITLELARTTFTRFQEARLEERVADAVLSWAGTASIEVVRVDVRPRMKPPVAEIWLVVDLPYTAAERVAPVSQFIPERLKGQSIRSYVLPELGTHYDVVVRFQTRYSGAFSLSEDTGEEREAPSVQETLGSE